MFSGRQGTHEVLTRVVSIAIRIVQHREAAIGFPR